ncbi:TatD DNase family protein [Chitinophaga costaii]|uniref:TatD DNase family protein n=1 Tax=Chitinophaga costaii TaxID=1335309 RepID=A0A1C4DUF5_9BACT|nr:TatD family hydrolase [Chitinophaga costaii]PUZ27796.1 TatD family deoxyribonuclease [Chitinophaga costaii]SCC34922.1 TatD DNase family protein [Chitinophaga costaii]
MNWTDTHTHLYSDSFNNDREAMIQRALAAGVTTLLLPNIDETTMADMLTLEAQFPENCFPMMGLHPVYVKENVETVLDIMRDWFSRRTFIGVGEIGLDFYWDTTFRAQQEHAFREQLLLARQYQLPVSIHSRSANAECIAGVRALQDGGLSGVFHCFSGTLEEAREIIDLGFYLGIGGVLTFKNGGLNKIVEQIGLEHLVLETDAPYLAPVPYRGKRNESAYIPLIGQQLADIKNLKIEEVAAITSSNARKIFKMH